MLILKIIIIQSFKFKLDILETIITIRNMFKILILLVQYINSLTEVRDDILPKIWLTANFVFLP